MPDATVPQLYQQYLQSRDELAALEGRLGMATKVVAELSEAAEAKYQINCKQYKALAKAISKGQRIYLIDGVVLMPAAKPAKLMDRLFGYPVVIGNVDEVCHLEPME